MLDLAVELKIKNIIFKNTDRLGRNDIDWPRCKKLAREKGFKIHLYELRIIFSNDSTAEEEMFFDNISVMARYWSNKISQGVKGVYKKKLERQQTITAPMGYLWDKDEKKWVIDKKTEHIIRELFDLYDKWVGRGCQKIKCKRIQD